MNPNSSSPAAENREGGYGSPTPEDEMPPSSATNPGPAKPTLDDQQGDEEVADTRQGETANQEDSTDPLLEPLDPSAGKPETEPALNEDLKKANTPEPPD